MEKYYPHKMTLEEIEKEKIKLNRIGFLVKDKFCHKKYRAYFLKMAELNSKYLDYVFKDIMKYMKANKLIDILINKYQVDNFEWRIEIDDGEENYVIDRNQKEALVLKPSESKIEYSNDETIVLNFKDIYSFIVLYKNKSKKFSKYFDQLKEELGDKLIRTYIVHKDIIEKLDKAKSLLFEAEFENKNFLQKRKIKNSFKREKCHFIKEIEKIHPQLKDINNKYLSTLDALIYEGYLEKEDINNIRL